MKALTREQSRAVDQWAIRELGLTGLVLMENAGRWSEAFLAHIFHPASEGDVY
jgi:NAD(P)H-hydrate repair Nnr-like enzyme with NAD(P)H-hydrate epimerase domain